MHFDPLICVYACAQDGVELPYEHRALKGVFDRFVIRIPERDVRETRAILYAISDEERK